MMTAAVDSAGGTGRSPGGEAGAGKAGKKRARGGGGDPASAVADRGSFGGGGAGEAVRRSGRIRNHPAPIYTSFEVDEDLGDASTRVRCFGSFPWMYQYDRFYEFIFFSFFLFGAVRGASRGNCSPRFVYSHDSFVTRRVSFDVRGTWKV